MRIFRSKDVRIALAVVGSLFAGPVTAFEGTKLACLFTTECYDAANCAGADRVVTVSPDGQGVVLTDTGETIPAEIVEIDGTRAFFGQANGALRLLTGIERETARMSIHSAGGDLMLNYTGICEEAG